MAETCLLILGDQLFPTSNKALKGVDHILMIEDHNLCTHFKYHKHKITFFLNSMRDYRDQLEKKKLPVSYYSADHKLFKKDFWSKVKDFLKNNPKVSVLRTYEVSDHFFQKQLEKFVKASKIELEEYENPSFLTRPSEFRDYLSGVKRPFMATFYSQQRKKLNILMTKKGEPEGGKWSFDTENRKKYPKNVVFPEKVENKKSNNFDDVAKGVEKHFSNHPGSTDNFWLETKRDRVLKRVDEFIEIKFNDFGPYEDAIHNEDVFGFHSVLSPYINNGLITPAELVDKIVDKGKKNKVPLASIEGYVRQVIGWREFVKGIYDNYSDRMETENYWNHKRRLTDHWYDGTTGLPPLDDSIKKAQEFGYTHHIERLMVLSNIMLLSEIDPKEVYRWFMEMYVDSADWVMAANVYGMGQMSEGGIFATKPYICGSNYIIKMSNYKKDEWCETLDGLYWRFIEIHKTRFAKNPRMSMMAKMLDKIESGRRKRIFKKANIFIEEMTQ